MPAVLNLMRLLDNLQILSLGRGPPLKIVAWKIAKICLFVCLYPCKIKKVAFARGPPGRCPRTTSGSADHRLRTADLSSFVQGRPVRALCDAQIRHGKSRGK